MPTFFYRARDDQGLLVTGEQEAIGAEEIRLFLADRGLIPIAVKKAVGGLGRDVTRGLFRRGVKPTEILIMTRQFYTLFKAGMGMEEILGTLARQTTHKKLKEVLKRVRTNVSTGESLSKAFAHHQEVFGDLYVSMLAAGEEAGILEAVLASLADLFEKEVETRASVRSATLYPKIVVFVLGIAITVLMTVVVPKFASFYAHYHAELPLPTRIVMGVSDLAKQAWHIGGLAAFGLWLAFRRYARTARGKIRVGALQLKLPVFGPLNLKVGNARFCHILAALYRSGLPINRCLEITAGTIENGAFIKDVELLKGEVVRGRTLSEGMAAGSFFMPIVVDATAVGEKTGSIDEMLEAMGNHYDMEVRQTIKNLTTLLEPILLFLIFGMVALLALSVFLPIWNMSRAVTGH